MSKLLIAFSFLFITIIIYSQDLINLFHLSLNNTEYNHLLLIPVVSIFFIFTDRNRIFSEHNTDIYLGKFILALAGLIFIVSKCLKSIFATDASLSLSIFSYVIMFAGIFAIMFGTYSLRKAAFPLLFLLFMVPIPAFILDNLVVILLKCSAETTEFLFKTIGVPHLREGFIFHLPGISVEIAKECSGIRSTMALFITSILVGHLFLNRFYSKLILALAVLPITIFKNGLRIVTLSILGAFIDRSWLTNSLLHSNGGIIFFIMALAILFSILFLLRKNEPEKMGTLGKNPINYFTKGKKG